MSFSHCFPYEIIYLCVLKYNKKMVFYDNWRLFVQWPDGQAYMQTRLYCLVACSLYYPIQVHETTKRFQQSIAVS